VLLVATGQQQDQLNVALAAVTCGRLSHAEQVVAARAPYRARADKYGVIVTDTRSRGPWNGDSVLELWGAEMLAFESPLKRATRRADPLERARVAARAIRDHDLDSLEIAYSDGVELSADRVQVALYGPRRRLLRRRQRLVYAPLGELL
jgi:hypothetical protein